MTLFKKISIIILLMACSTQVKATHLIGGYMNYEFLDIDSSTGEYRYKVSLHIYRDCFNGVQIPLDKKIDLGVYLNNDNKDIYARVSFGLVYQANVPAPGAIDCDYYKTKVCIEYGYYEGIISLRPNTQGYHLTFARCCRNLQNNIVQDGGPTQGQTYHCFIPSTSLDNSSPAFYGVPSPYMCVNDTVPFLFDAVDKDGDSLVYRLMRPYQGGTIANSTPIPPGTLSLPDIRYRTGYSFSSPFGAGGFASVDPKTGLTLLYSTQTGSFVVGVEVLEYRNGKLLSTVRMDLQILVLDCPPNKTPDISSSKGNRFVIEEGEELCFDVLAQDPDGDLVKLRGRGSILGKPGGNAVASFRDTFGTPSVISEFCWTPECGMARSNPYFVYFEVEDGGCPPKFNYLDVEIVVKPFEGAKVLIGPNKVCRYSEFVYQVTDGKVVSDFEWDISQGQIIGANNTKSINIKWTGSGTGKVRVREVVGNGCIGEWIEMDVTIIESPALPLITGKDTICVDDIGLIYSVTDNASSSFYWETVNASIGVKNRNSVQLASFSEPSFMVRAVEINSQGCASDTAKKEVYVSRANPIIVGPVSICPNATDVVYEVANENGSIYNWIIVGGVQKSGGTSSRILVDWGNKGAGEVSVQEVNRHGCKSAVNVLNIDKTYNFKGEPIQGQLDVCEYDKMVPYGVLTVSGIIYKWTVSGGSQVAGDSTSDIRIDWGAAGGGTVGVLQKAYDKVNNKLCASVLEQVAVVIHPKPIADEIVGVMEMCQYSDSITYIINGYAGSTYEWTLDGSSAGIVGQGSSQIKVEWNSAGSFTLAVKEKSKFGCEGLVVDTIVLINPKPRTTPIVGAKIICPENALNHSYSVTGFATSTYSWFAEGNASVVGNGTPSIIIDWDMNVSSGTVSVLEVSDKGCPGDTQKLDIVIDRLAIDLRFVSVGLPDNQMEIDWQLESNSTVSSLLIQKRDADLNGAWQQVATVSGTTTNYVETNINTDLNAFDYRVIADNKCGTQIESEVHTSMLLKGIQDENFNSILNFSSYLGWDNGVNDYSLFGEDNRHSYQSIVPSIGPNDLTTVTHNPEQYRKCFRIKADENLGEQTSSWSNEICFYFSPEVFVPNAFTANNDDLNDGFGVKGIAINEFNILIFNRWGEKLYESNDIDEKWYPVYRDADIQMGTYIYLIKYTDFENKLFQKTGTINLLR